MHLEVKMSTIFGNLQIIFFHLRPYLTTLQQNWKKIIYSGLLKWAILSILLQGNHKESTKNKNHYDFRVQQSKNR